MHFETLQYDLQERVATVVLSRPERLNAMNRAMWVDLRGVVEHVRAAADTDSLRALIFKGAGDAFSTGGDISDFEMLQSSDDRRAYI